MIRLSRVCAAAGVAAAIALGTSAPADGYSLLTSRWANGTVTMNLKLGAVSGTNIDGSTSWDSVMTSALAAWNAHMSLVQFAAASGSGAANGDGNGVNTIFFSSTVYGEAFESGVLAITTEWFLTSNNQKSEADIIFNSGITWDSFRGNLRPGRQDFLRVAIHEAGHALGLDHPDEHGQSVTAIMNAFVSNVDSLQSDDISGAAALYGGGVTSNVAFPPRNETADFINRLIVVYRDELRAAGVTTYVDAEGAGVWVPEYTRYRVGQCDHSTAESRVFSQITNSGTYGVCALTPAGAIPFPPRNEGLVFMNDLNDLYRNTLGRTAGTSFVDNEGIVVWVMEYLRYRLNGCGHEDGVNKVFMQIRGQGIQPVCSA